MTIQVITIDTANSNAKPSRQAMQDNNFNAKEQRVYAPPGPTEVHLVDRNNGNCLRYPSISNDPVAVWSKSICIADIQSPKRLVHVFRTV